MEFARVGFTATLLRKSQKVATAYFSSKQFLPFGFARQHRPIIIIMLTKFVSLHQQILPQHNHNIVTFGFTRTTKLQEFFLQRTTKENSELFCEQTVAIMSDDNN